MQYDTIVVGAGIEGSAAAYDLAKRGRKTLLLEQVLVDCCSGSTERKCVENYTKCHNDFIR